MLWVALVATPTTATTAESLLSGLPLANELQAQWALPSRLSEISGLAMTPDRRLLAVDDEKAVVYEIDYVSGRLVKAFALGKPVLREDFEGIAVIGETVYLLTSGGDLYAAAEGDDGDRASFRKFDTGLGDECEFEGLAQDPDEGRLLLLCKSIKRKASIDTVAIIPWSLDAQAAALDARIELPIKDISLELRARHLHPSGIVVEPRSGAMLIVAARERALIELDADGDLAEALVFPRSERHPQAEGIEIGAGGELIIADEARNGPPRLTVYAPGRSAHEVDNNNTK